ncbi:MAG: recombinase family protein [Bacilli bacterium]|nr:recombinase family protein [Bacilli bacterium]MDY4618635.1 recombinase family protein [Bacilli bacterium]
MNYNAGIYIRLSQEDKNKKYESDSESIINQKEILKDYCLKNRFNLIDEYVDDGYSGTNFDRPGFIRLIEDIKNKKINLVVVKDLSRLGRDHVMTGYYIETYFPENKIRFISIVENYDSMKNQASNDSSTFIIACNDYYSKQNSLKIRNVLDSKRRDGKFIGSKPCYGYMRDPKDKGHLIIDPNTAQYVKLIFELRSNDIGISEIATRLTKLRAPTPSSYKNKIISTITKEEYVWSIHSVKKILENRMYTGDMVQHTQTKISYKSKKKIKLDQSLWVIVENTHEPLVDKEIFRIINKKRDNHNRKVEVKTKRPIRLLEGLIYCKECGNRLSVIYRKNHNYWTINCNRYARDPIREKCKTHFFPYDNFEEEVLEQLKILLSNLFKELNVKELNAEIINGTNLGTKSFDEIKKSIEKDILKLSSNIQTAYQDRIDGNISLESYKMIVSPYEQKKRILKDKLEEIELEILKRKNGANKIPNYTKKIKELLNIEKPNRDLLFTIIDRIEADEYRNVTIKFKYKILEDYTFTYIDKNLVKNPYGRCGKKHKI